MGKLEIFNFEQGTPEWREARRGLPTSSNFSSILAKGEGKTRRTYLCRLVGEILTGEVAETFSNDAMERGKIMEAEARAAYAFMYDADPVLVGFIRNGAKGSSPDALLGNDGALEIKTKKPELLVEVLLKGEIPSEHKAQLQGNLWVAERDYIDLAVYFTGMPLFVKRMGRDEAYIQSLATAVDAFNAELAETVERIRRMGAREAA